MAIVYVLAHFDDEFCALPLIEQGMAAGAAQRFIYLADYADPRLTRRRHDETRAFFRRIGMAEDPTLHLGAGKGWMDGELYRHTPAAYAALAEAAAAGPVERLVTLAWEGGHADHDICTALTARLAAELGGVPVDQLCIYHGKGLPGWLYLGFSPLAENGPATTLQLGFSALVRWMRLAGAYPSQMKTWCGLLPAMAAAMLAQGGFRYQQLAPGRIAERPHAGRLLYERMFKVPYEEVRAGADMLKAPN